jgi:peptidyl-prolyl cis-trans isomerase SurA
LSFKSAALRYSEDDQSKLNDGLMVNPMNASTRFELDALPPQEFNVIKDLKVGEISKAFESVDLNGKIVYKIIRINKIIDSHRADLKNDYGLIEQMAIMDKQQKIIDNWINEKRSKTYIHIDESFIKCEFLKEGWIK